MNSKVASLFLVGWFSLFIPAVGQGSDRNLPEVSGSAPVTAPVVEKNHKPAPKTAPISGVINLSEKYDTNFDPADESVGATGKSGTITELLAQLAYRNNWARAWLLEIDFLGLADWPARDLKRSWYLGNANLYFGYSSGPQTLSFSNEAKYVAGPRKKNYYLSNAFPGNGTPFSPGNLPGNQNFPQPEPRTSIPPGDFSFLNTPSYDLTGFDLPQNDLDFFRNSSVISYRRTLSPLWRMGIGYENTANLYPGNHAYDFSLNGWFLEVRNNWTPELSTRYGYTFQYSLGNFGPRPGYPPASSGVGYRHTMELGVDWFFTSRDSLNGTYAFLVDDSTEQGASEFGWTGENGGQNFPTRFTYYKHKGSLLYLHLFPHRVTLSVYAELMRRSFSSPDSGLASGKRNDIFLLSSLWLKAPIIRNIFGRACYTYRWDRASDSSKDFQDHIFQLGIEYQF